MSVHKGDSGLGGVFEAAERNRKARDAGYYGTNVGSHHTVGENMAYSLGKDNARNGKSSTLVYGGAPISFSKIFNNFVIFVGLGTVGAGILVLLGFFNDSSSGSVSTIPEREKFDLVTPENSPYKNSPPRNFREMTND